MLKFYTTTLCILLGARLACCFDQLLLRTAEKRLVQTGDHDAPRWITEAEIDNLRRHKIKFMDITDTYQLLQDEFLHTGSIRRPKLASILVIYTELQVFLKS